jgi:hypothetical protein
MVMIASGTPPHLSNIFMDASPKCRGNLSSEPNILPQNKVFELFRLRGFILKEPPTFIAISRSRVVVIILLAQLFSFKACLISIHDCRFHISSITMRYL